MRILGHRDHKNHLGQDTRPKDGRYITLFMLEHLAYGTVGALVCGALVLYFNVGGIYNLAVASQDAIIFIFLLFFGLFVTFGSISIAMGIMGLGSFSDNDSYRDEREGNDP